MAIVMMRQTTKNVVLTEEIVVDHASSLIFAKIVHAFQIQLVLEFPMPLLEMDSAMMKPTMLLVVMIMEIAVYLILIQIIAQNALVIC